jgi:FKBP-type peptidyl-prolyl cis-trans isomerase (trigger factor)
MEDLRNEARPAADTRLKQSLVLIELANSEEIKVEPQELEQETKRTLDFLSNSLSQKEMRRFSNQDVFSNMVGNIMTDMITQRAIERLREIARGAMDDANIGVGIESYPTPIPSQEVSSPEE